MTKQIVVQNIGATSEWRTIFQYVLSYCNQFAVTFPDGEYDDDNPLMGGKNEFELLNDVEVKKSTDMAEGIVLSAILSKHTVALFEKYMAPSYDGFKPVLWDFKLLKDDEPVLGVSDFTVGILYMSAPIEDFLVRARIDIDSLEK